MELPEPTPLMIDIGETFLVDPRMDEEDGHRRQLQFLALTPEERWRWNIRWNQFVKAALRQGADLEALVYPSDRAV